MTGTDEFSENLAVSRDQLSLTSPSTIELKTMAVSSIGSPLPSCKSLTDRKLALPPSCVIATSKDTLVLVKIFQIKPRNLPSRALETLFLDLSSREFLIILSRSSTP